MISLQKIGIVYNKELRDILRDRRTLYSMILLPILLYPLLSVGIGALIGSQMEKTRAARQQIVILGEEHDPALAASLHNLSQVEVLPLDSLHTGLLLLAQKDSTLNRALIDQLFGPQPELVPDSLTNSFFARVIDEKLIRAVVRIPPGFAARVTAGDSVALTIVYDKAEVKSDAAYDKLHDWAVAYRDSVVGARLAGHGLDKSVLKPFWIVNANVASSQKMGGMLLGMMMPYMMLILVIAGGMYPALDMTAGEKERNTLETLLAAPLSRFDIAAGKFLTTFTAGMVSMILSMISMTFTMKYVMASVGEGEVAVSLSTASVFWLLFMMIPTATMFSSLMIAIAIGAKSSKKARAT